LLQENQNSHIKIGKFYVLDFKPAASPDDYHIQTKKNNMNIIKTFLHLVNDILCNTNSLVPGKQRKMSHDDSKHNQRLLFQKQELQFKPAQLNKEAPGYQEMPQVC
jgi:hypothetical protein